MGIPSGEIGKPTQISLKENITFIYHPSHPSSPTSEDLPIMSDLQDFPSFPQIAQMKGSLPLTLTLPLSLLGHHVATNTEVQPLQSWLQPYVDSIPQSVVHSEGPHHDSDN